MQSVPRGSAVLFPSKKHVDVTRAFASGFRGRNDGLEDRSWAGGGTARRPRPRQGRGAGRKENGKGLGGRAKKEGAAAAGSNHTPVRRRPPKAAAACSPTLPGSTIGASGLNFSVRNGKRCGPAASPPLVFPGPHTTGAPYAGRENFEMKSQT